MAILTVCKNVIQSNNKKGWVNAEPAIRIANSKSGKAVGRSHSVSILDKNGDAVAEIVTTKDGKAIVKCGAKVAIFTKYPVSSH